MTRRLRDGTDPALRNPAPPAPGRWDRGVTARPSVPHRKQIDPPQRVLRRGIEWNAIRESMGKTSIYAFPIRLQAKVPCWLTRGQ